jgi:hypothetical protein
MNTIPNLIAVAVLTVLAPLRSHATAVIWVAPGGTDSASGAQERPFATLPRAVQAVRELWQKGTERDVAIRLRAGTYRLKEPLEFTAAEAGNARFDLTIMAVPGERVVIAGSRELSGTWQRVQQNLWMLPVPEARDGRWVFRSLFRGGEAQPRAREPDEGHYTVAAVEDDRRRLKLHPRLPAAWRDLAGVEINSIAHWHFNRQPAAALTEDSVTGRRGIGTDVSGARITEKSHSRVWLENALVFADTPGEWFLDSAKGELYYVAAAGEDPNRVGFSAPLVSELIVVRGSPEKLVRNLRFQGLEFAETDWVMPAEGRLGVQAGAWALDRSLTFSPGAALRFIYAHGTTVQSCVFRDLGEGAVSFEIGTRGGLVSGCEFRRVGSNAIQVGRMPEYTGDRHPLHRDFASLGAWVEAQEKLPGSDAMWKHASTTVREAPAQIVIADNTLLDCGRVDFGSVAIAVTYAQHVTIEHNLIRGLPYSAISVGWRWAAGLTNCHSHLIRRNRIEHIMQQAGDGGGIYLVGEQPGTRVLENYIHDSGRNYWAHGIYPDENSDHMEIVGNYVTSVMDHAIFMNRNGANQILRDNNGESGATAITGEAIGRRWVKFAPERTPPDLSFYGPRQRREPR